VKHIPAWFFEVPLDWIDIFSEDQMCCLFMSSFWKGDIDDMIPHKFSGQHTMVAHAMTTHDTPENATKPTSPGREHKAQNSSRPNGTFSNHRSSIRKPERLLGVKAVHLLVSRLGVTCLVLPGSGQL